MLLNNFIVSLASGVAAPTTRGSSNPLHRQSTAGPTFKISSGTVDTINSISGSLYSNTANNSSITHIGGYQGIALGTGTTPPTYSDFKIETPVEPSGYSNNSYSISADCQQVLAQSYTNKSSEDVIVTELGLFVTDNISNESFPKVLLTRNVISPVTIKPNETKTFTIKIDYNKFSDAYSVG